MFSEFSEFSEIFLILAFDIISVFPLISNVDIFLDDKFFFDFFSLIFIIWEKSKLFVWSSLFSKGIISSIIIFLFLILSQDNEIYFFVNTVISSLNKDIKFDLTLFSIVLNIT